MKPESLELRPFVRELYTQFGQRKEMGRFSSSPDLPHFFLLRTFLGENDLLVIFNTKRCRYQCHFCQLPEKSSRDLIPGESITRQFGHVMEEERHAVSVLDRLTFSNEGSVLDADTFPPEALLEIIGATYELRRVRRIVFETRLEFVDPEVIARIKERNPRARIDILTGYETLDPTIRDEILGKNEPLSVFEQGLNCVAESGCDLTAFVLFKPSPYMTDQEAYDEAQRSVDYLIDQCGRRSIPLAIRINPMYLAEGSKWAEMARATSLYQPPRLTDILCFAKSVSQREIPVYIGLSTEGLDEESGTYRDREDFSLTLLKQAILFNNRKG